MYGNKNTWQSNNNLCLVKCARGGGGEFTEELKLCYENSFLKNWNNYIFDVVYENILHLLPYRII